MPAKADAGYSGTPLWKKLGFKTGMKVCVLNPPANYEKLIAGPNDWIMVTREEEAEALHLFLRDVQGLKKIASLARLFPPAAMLWVSWPKLSSPLSTGLKEDHIRETAIANGLVDVKVCAIDADWSGLKLMLRKDPKMREAHARSMSLKIAARK
jgi:hypothetical protein